MKNSFFMTNILFVQFFLTVSNTQKLYAPLCLLIVYSWILYETNRELILICNALGLMLLLPVVGGIFNSFFCMLRITIIFYVKVLQLSVIQIYIFSFDNIYKYNSNREMREKKWIHISTKMAPLFYDLQIVLHNILLGW